MRFSLTAFFVMMCCLAARGQFVGLIVNEFSQGASANKEYIELLVVGNRTCTDSTADLRGWIVDDQNGWYGNSNSTPGHYRFKNDVNWAAVPFGSIILLYNANDKNASITLADDPTDVNNDLAYIVPVASPYIEQFALLPDNNSGVSYNYPAAGVTAGYTNTTNQWQFYIALNNSNGDVISLVSPSNRSSASFSIGYGYTIGGGYQNPYVSITNVPGGNNAYLSTANYANPSHWVVSAVPANETPGLPNGGANTAWINSMRLPPPSIMMNGSASDRCVSTGAQIISLPYTATTNNPTTYSIDWVSPLLTDVNNAALGAAPGLISYSIPASLPAGAYTGSLWVSNGSGQSCAPVPVSFTLHPLPNLVLTPSAASFCAGNSGVGITAGGAVSYTWSPANGLSATTGSSVVAIPAATQTYTVTGTDANGCVQTANATITVNPRPMTPLLSVTNPNCGELTGAIQITAPVGSGLAYSVNGSGYQSSPLFSNVNPGTYTVVAIDANSCMSTPATATIQVPPPMPPAPTVSLVQPTCSQPTGTIQIQAPAAAGFSLNNGPFLPVTSFANLPPGTYTVTAQNAAGCFSTATNVTINTAPATPVVSVNAPVICTGTNATITATVSPFASYTFNWTVPPTAVNPGNVSSFVATVPGIYTVTVTNSSGCTATASGLLTVQASAAVTADDKQVCTGSVIALTGTPGGGVWSGIGVVPGSNIFSSTGLNPGTYTVSYFVSGSAGCNGVATADITVAPVPSAPGAGVNNSCSGTSTLIAVNYTGALLWSNGVTTAIQTVTTPGVYTVTQTLNGCTSPATVVVASPYATPPAPVVTVAQPNCLTPAGTITVTAPVGEEYSIDNFATSNITGLFTGLPAGTYTVMVRNAAGCVSLPSLVTILPPPVVPPAPAVSAIDYCNGTSVLTASNYTGGLLWSTGATTASITVTTAGNYSVTQTANGCASAPAVITANPQGPPSQPQVAILQQPDCWNPSGPPGGGSIAVVSPTGAGYTYSIDGVNYTNSTGVFNNVGGNFFVTAQSPAGCISNPTLVSLPGPGPATAPTVTVQQPGCSSPAGSITITSPLGSGYSYSIDGVNYQVGSSFTNLTPGTYQVTYRVNGICYSANRTVFIGNPPPVPAMPVVTAVSPTCTVATGSITITSPVGAGLSYSINGTVYQPSPTFNNLPAGTYSITVRNAQGCISAATVFNLVRSAGSLSTSLSACIVQGQTYTLGNLVLTSSGSYSYTFTSTTGCDSIVRLQLVVRQTVIKDTAACVSLLYNGITYTQSVTLRDTIKSVVTNCDSIHRITNITIHSPPALTQLTVCRGVGQTYAFNGNVLSTSGTYTAQFTNANGCDSTVRLQLVIAQAATFNLSGCRQVLFEGRLYTASVSFRDTITSILSNCDSLYRNIQITVVPPVQSNITVCRPPGSNYFFNGQLFTASGNYSDTLTSAAGCDSMVHLRLVIATAENLSLRACGKVLHNGATYTSSTVLIQTIPSLLTGCDSVVRNINIIVDPLPSLSVSAAGNSICRGDSILLKASSNVLVSWVGFGSEIIKVSPASTTTYTAVAMNNAGCTDTASLTIEVKDFRVQLTASANSVFSGANVQLNASAATPFSVVSWTPASLFQGSVALRPVIVVDSTVWVTVMAQSNNGCRDSAGMLITADPMADVYIPNAFTPNGDGRNDVFKILGGQFQSFDLKIFNRWGELVFATTERTRGWDGKQGGREQPSQVYVWVLTAKPKSGGLVSRKGTITLMR
jgi:gliding motility-associated-like protein